MKNEIKDVDQLLEEYAEMIKSKKVKQVLKKKKVKIERFEKIFFLSFAILTAFSVWIMNDIKSPDSVTEKVIQFLIYN